MNDCKESGGLFKGKHVLYTLPYGDLFCKTFSFKPIIAISVFNEL